MNKTNPAVKYGILGGCILGAIWVLSTIYTLSMLKKINVEDGSLFNSKTILIGFLLLICVAVIFVVCIVRTVSEYRKVNTEYNFRNLVMQGMLATLILVLIYNGIIYVYSEVISPETIRQTMELTKEITRNAKMNLSDDQKEKILRSIDMKTPVRQLVSRLGITLVLGMIITLISATVMNKRNYTNPNQMR
ncbi:MAG TPA: DUF4199 domain-containing protein [Chitinophagaceae bacterium]|nr:DUF4199 domain-containing protein [Chitinophagaceae bacterium]